MALESCSNCDHYQGEVPDYTDNPYHPDYPCDVQPQRRRTWNWCLKWQSSDETGDK